MTSRPIGKGNEYISFTVEKGTAKQYKEEAAAKGQSRNALIRNKIRQSDAFESGVIPALFEQIESLETDVNAGDSAPTPQLLLLNSLVGSMRKKIIQNILRNSTSGDPMDYNPVF